MPRGNGTGPSGFGSMTGRGAGFCAGFSTPGYTNQVREGGFSGYGRGRGGRGWRNQYYATGLPRWARDDYRGYPGPYECSGYSAPVLTREAEMNMLKEQAQAMQKEVSAINDRIKELETLASDQKD